MSISGNDSTSTGQFIRHALSLLLPAAANMSITQALTPILAAILARSIDPDASIGGYGLALSISMLVGLPHLRIQQMTLVFAENGPSLVRLRYFTIFLAAQVTVIAGIVIAPGVDEIILGHVFSVTGGLRDEAARSLVWFVPLPGFLVLKMHLYGVALRLDKPRLLWIGTGVGALTVVVVSAFLFATDALEGARIAAASMTTGAVVETVLMTILTARPTREFLSASRAADPPASYAAMGGFFGPMLFAALVPAVTWPILNAGMARTTEPDTAIAAVSMAYGVFALVTIANNGVQATVLALFAQGKHPRRVRRFAIGVGVGTLIPFVLIAFIPPLTQLVLGDIMGATGRLYEMAALALRLFTLVPLALAIEQLYTGALMRSRITRPLVYIIMWRLAFLLAWVFGTVTYTDWSGAVIGAGGSVATFMPEAFFAWVYGRAHFNAMLSGSLHTD